MTIHTIIYQIILPLLFIIAKSNSNLVNDNLRTSFVNLKKNDYTVKYFSNFTINSNIKLSDPTPTSNYKSLEFEIIFELKNISTNILDEKKKNIIIGSFEIITGIESTYIELKIENQIKIENESDIPSEIFKVKTNQILSSIYYSIPLVNKYKKYNDIPTELFDLVSIKILNSFDTGKFTNIIKNNSLEYNITIFDTIESEIINITKPTITETSSQTNSNTNKIVKILLITFFGLFGIILIGNIYFRTVVKNKKKINSDILITLSNKILNNSNSNLTKNCTVYPENNINNVHLYKNSIPNLSYTYFNEIVINHNLSKILPDKDTNQNNNHFDYTKIVV
jgi:hypothetical protein